MNAFICEYYDSLLYVVKKVLMSVMVFTVIMLNKDILQIGRVGGGNADKLEIYWDTVYFYRLF